MLKKHRWMSGMSSSVRWGQFWVGVSGPGHSSAMRLAATMYGQSCRVPGRGGVGPLRFGGASLCWGRSLTFHSHWSVGIPQVRWVHLARQYIALPRPWFPLRMESSVSRDLRSQVPQRCRLSGSSSLAYVSGPGLCVGGGGVVGGEEGVGAVHHPVASGCVVVGGGEGVVHIVHEGHVRGGGCPLVAGAGTSPGTWCLKLLRKAIRETHVSLSHSLVSLGVALGGGWAMSGSW